MLFAFHSGNSTTSSNSSSSSSGSAHRSRSTPNTTTIHQNGVQSRSPQPQQQSQSQQPQLIISSPSEIEPIDNNNNNTFEGRDSSFWRFGPSSNHQQQQQLQELQEQQPPSSTLPLRVVEEENASIIPSDSSSTSSTSTSNNSMSSRSSQGSASQSSLNSSSEHNCNTVQRGSSSLTPMMNRLGPSSSSSSSASPSGLQRDEQSTLSRSDDNRNTSPSLSNRGNSRPPLFSLTPSSPPPPPPCASTSASASDMEIVEGGDWSLSSNDQLASLDRVVRLATRLTAVPVAIISRTSSSKTGDELQVLSHFGLDKMSWSHDDVYQVLKLPDCSASASSSSSSSSMIPFCQHVPLQSGSTSTVVGTLSLLASQPRSPLTLDERQDLEDLIFLAAQAMSSAATTTSSMNDQSAEAATKAVASSTPPLSSPGHNRVRRKVSTESAVSPSTPAPSNNNSYQHHHKAQRQATPPPIRRPSFQKQQQQQKHKRGTSRDLSTATVSSVWTNNHEDEEEASRCIIACTAHDLLTPLMGLQLSLSLLQEDPKFVRHLEEQPLQRESFWTAWQSTEVMFRMCQTTIDTLRANKHRHEEDDNEEDNDDDVAGDETVPSAPTSSSSLSRRRPTEICDLDLTVLLQSLQRLMDPIPKRVPLVMTLTKYIPDQVPVITTTASTSGASNIATGAATTSETVDWHILRCAMTILSHACRVSSSSSNEQQQRKAIQMRIKLTGGGSSSSSGRNGKNKSNRNKRLVIECEHDCPDMDIDMTASLYASPASLSSAHTLALKSIAYQMENVYGGQHGFTRPQMDQSRAIFWFSVPVSSSESTFSSSVPSHDRVITLAPTPMMQEEDNVPSSHPSVKSARTKDDNEDVAMVMVDCKKTGSPKQTSRRSHTTKLPSPLGFNGPRRLRRSSIGTTNVLGGRRRTFNDMLGLRREVGSRATGLELTASVKALPTMFRCQTHANHNWNDGGHSNKIQHRNFQYSSNACGNGNGGSGNKLGTGLAINALTAQTAMAAVFQTSLVSISTPQGASDPMDLRNSAFGCRDALHDNGGNRRLSYSTIQEEARLLEEKALVKPLFGSIDSSRSTSGLERCFQDIMGTTVTGNLLQSSKTKETSNDGSGMNGRVPWTAERVRERILFQQQQGASTVKPVLGMTSAASSPSPAGQLRERKALVIDDSLVIRKTVARALTKLGVQTVLQACDGVEGVQRMKEDAFEIVLCDFSMPNLGGVDCVKLYRQWESEAGNGRPKQHIVGMSAHANPGDIAQGMKVGMNEYQPKPLTIKRLGELLESPPVKMIREQLGCSSNKKGLFADITASTVMLDAMNSSSTSASYGDSQTDGGALKRPKTEGLFSLSSS